MSNKAKIGDIVAFHSNVGIVVALDNKAIWYLAIKGFKGYVQGVNGLYGFSTNTYEYGEYDKVIGNMNNNFTMASILYKTNKRSK